MGKILAIKIMGVMPWPGVCCELRQQLLRQQTLSAWPHCWCWEMGLSSYSTDDLPRNPGPCTGLDWS